MNSVHLTGRLGREPERRSTQAGKTVCTFSIATDEREQDRDGKWIKRPEWHRIVVWDRQAEACAAHLTKGSLVAVEGRLRTRKWQDRDGVAHHTTEVIARSVEFLGGGRSNSDGGRQDDRQDYDQGADDGTWDDSIPF